METHEKPLPLPLWAFFAKLIENRWAFSRHRQQFVYIRRHFGAL
jgi:hypothetical protein